MVSGELKLNQVFIWNQEIKLVPVSSILKETFIANNHRSVAKSEYIRETFALYST